MKFIYYLAATGQPFFNIKNEILHKNLNYIYKNLNQKIDLMINTYQEDEDCLEKYYGKNLCEFVDKVYIHKKKGILSELWYSNPYHELLIEYDYIFFILDDVEIENIDINELVNIKNKYSLDIISPKIINATWYHMKDMNKGLALVNHLEIFCLLLNYENFKKFLSINTIENSNIWGVDLLFGFFNIKVGIYYKYSVIHKIIKSISDKSNAVHQMNLYIKKHGFNSVDDILKKYPSRKEIIIKP